ncbi:MAG: hypothetical protein R3F59_22915 [Myxococcota bacterium]
MAHRRLGAPMLPSTLSDALVALGLALRELDDPEALPILVAATRATPVRVRPYAALALAVAPTDRARALAYLQFAEDLVGRRLLGGDPGARHAPRGDRATRSLA